MVRKHSSIKDLFAEFQKGRPSKLFVRKLAEVCWRHTDAEIGELQLAGIQEIVLTGSLSNEPAVLFCGHDRPRSIDLLQNIGLLAYHFSIEWGIITNRVDTLIFNSHWLRDGNFYRLPLHGAHGSSINTSLLELFTPEAMLDGKFEKAIKSRATLDQQLLPVDEALVNELDIWRSEAMRYAKWSSGIDESVQLLFSQLFILRAVEDRRLIPDMPTLESTISRTGDLDLTLLEARFEMARSKIQSELFDIGPAKELPSFVVAGIIRELYKPRHLSALNARYNFQWIPADVLGRAYEKYLSNVLVPTRVPLGQGRLFAEPQREVEKVSIRKVGGVFYTPEFITRYLADRAIKIEQQTPRASGAMIPRIADIACGSGSFLTAALDVLLKRLRKQDPLVNWGKRVIDQKRLLGIDIDRRAVTLARLSIWLRLAEEPDALPLPRLTECIVEGDALESKTWRRLPDSLDIVLGNPPFLAAASLPNRDSLSKRFETAEGRFDYAFLFYEQAIKRLRTGGAMGMVTPNRVFTNRDAAAARDFITTNMTLVTIVDFGGLEVFTGISAYVGLLLGVKAVSRLSPKPDVRVVSVKSLPPRFPGALIAAVDNGESETINEYLRAFDGKQPKGRLPWVFLAPKELETRDRVIRDATVLAEVAECYQGIKTGCNEVFVVMPQQPVVGALAKVINRFGDQWEIECELLRPLVYGTDIQRYAPLAPSRLLIYPYRNGNVVSERELKQRYPKIYAYLDNYKNVLSHRRSLTESAGSKLWYELVRERSVAWLGAPKLVMRDLATVTSFSPDIEGSVFLVGGTAVVPNDSADLLPLLAFLNSKVANWYLKSVTPTFRSAFQKFEPQHLQQLSIPNVILNDDVVREGLSKAARLAMVAAAVEDSRACNENCTIIDQIIASAVGIALKEIHPS